MSGRAEENITMELILNILGAEFLKQKKQLNTSESKEFLSGFGLKE